MKTNCIYHRDQLITNFCKDKHCLMPLCPECISEHTQYHEDQRTRPIYATIHEILADVHTQINNCIDLLVEDKNRNGALIVNIQTVGDIVREKICVAREMVYQAIEESFLTMEKDLHRQLEKLHEDKSIYCLEKSERQDKCLLEHLDELQVMKNTLKGQRGLSNIIYFMREKQDEIQSFHSQFTTYLHTNESYQPKIQINAEALYSLDAVVLRVLKIGGNAGLSKKRTLEATHDNNRNTPAKISSAGPGNTVNRLKERHNVPFVESEIKNYSPRVSRVGVSKQKSRVKIDGDYEKLSRRVAQIREENDRLSRVLRRNENTQMS